MKFIKFIVLLTIIFLFPTYGWAIGVPKSTTFSFPEAPKTFGFVDRPGLRAGMVDPFWQNPNRQKIYDFRATVCVYRNKYIGSGKQTRTIESYSAPSHLVPKQYKDDFFENDEYSGFYVDRVDFTPRSFSIEAGEESRCFPNGLHLYITMKDSWLTTNKAVFFLLRACQSAPGGSFCDDQGIILGPLPSEEPPSPTPTITTPPTLTPTPTEIPTLTPPVTVPPTDTPPPTLTPPPPTTITPTVTATPTPECPYDADALICTDNNNNNICDPEELIKDTGFSTKYTLANGQTGVSVFNNGTIAYHTSVLNPNHIGAGFVTLNMPSGWKVVKQFCQDNKAIKGCPTNPGTSTTINLNLACNVNYDYGWLLKREGAPTGKSFQLDWVINNEGKCWVAWADSSCNLRSHEGGGGDGYSCSQAPDGSDHNTTITNTSSQSVTTSCDRYLCQNCAAYQDGQHVQCNTWVASLGTITLAPGCSATCGWDGISNINCPNQPPPTSPPTAPSATPTTQPSVPTNTPKPGSPTPTPRCEYSGPSDCSFYCGMVECDRDPNDGCWKCPSAPTVTPTVTPKPGQPTATPTTKLTATPTPITEDLCTSSCKKMDKGYDGGVCRNQNSANYYRCLGNTCRFGYNHLINPTGDGYCKTAVNDSSYKCWCYLDRLCDNCQSNCKSTGCSTATPTPVPGTAGGPCVSGLCQNTLVCVSDICVTPTPTTPTTPTPRLGSIEVKINSKPCRNLSLGCNAIFGERPNKAKVVIEDSNNNVKGVEFLDNGGTAKFILPVGSYTISGLSPPSGCFITYNNKAYLVWRGQQTVDITSLNLSQVVEMAMDYYGDCVPTETGMTFAPVAADPDGNNLVNARDISVAFGNYGKTDENGVINGLRISLILKYLGKKVK